MPVLLLRHPGCTLEVVMAVCLVNRLFTVYDSLTLRPAQVLMHRGFAKEDVVAKMPELKAAMIEFAEANRLQHIADFHARAFAWRCHDDHEKLLLSGA